MTLFWVCFVLVVLYVTLGVMSGDDDADIEELLKRHDMNNER